MTWATARAARRKTSSFSKANSAAAPRRSAAATPCRFRRRRGLKVDFPSIAEKVRNVAHAEPKFNAFMLKAQIDPHELTVFADGRAIIKGTSKPQEARSIYARYIGA